MSATRRLRTLAILAAAAPCFYVAACSHSEASPLAPVPVASTDDLTINGITIPEAEVQRELVYTLGARDLKSKILDVQINAEKQRQLEAGADSTRFEFADQELADAKAALLEQIKAQYPDEDPEDILKINQMQVGNLEAQFRQTKLFDAVFLPENPEDWSETTLALLEGSGGPELIDKLKESYTQRQEQGIEVDPNDPGMMMWKNILRQLVMQGLNKSSVVQTGADGLPPETCLKVDEVEIKTADMYAGIADRVSEDDLRRTRMWVAKTRALAQDLAGKEALLDEEAFRARYAEHEEPYQGSPIPLEFVATGLQKFPSMDVYKQYFRLRESYKDMIADEINDENLTAHLGRANLLMGLAQVNAEVILFSAYDPKTSESIDGGWERARERALEATQKLADGADWGVILEEYSDFWDPPAPPPNPQMPQQQPAKKNKGRFGPLNRNDFIQRMNESDFDMFLSGQSLADYVFFDQEVGTTDGPFTGRQGYYITRVLTRGTSTRPALRLDNENQRELIVQDYLTMRLNEYAAGALDEADVVGLYPEGN